MNKRKDAGEIVKLYTVERLSTVQIANRLGSSVGAVGSCLVSNGVKLRSCAEGFRMRFPKGRFGKLAANWKGGLSACGPKGSYMARYAPDHPHATKRGYVMEHRVVVEKKLGRYLKPTEFVHHLNGNKKDNRIENLKVCHSKKEHSRAHFDAVKEVIRLKKILNDNGIKY